MAAFAVWIGWRIIREEPLTPAQIAAFEQADGRLAAADLLVDAEIHAASEFRTRRIHVTGFWWGVVAGAIGLFAVLLLALVLDFLLFYLCEIGPRGGEYRLRRKLIAVLHEWEADGGRAP